MKKFQIFMLLICVFLLWEAKNANAKDLTGDEIITYGMDPCPPEGCPGDEDPEDPPGTHPPIVYNDSFTNAESVYSSIYMNTSRTITDTLNRGGDEYYYKFVVPTNTGFDTHLFNIVGEYLPYSYNDDAQLYITLYDSSRTYIEWYEIASQYSDFWATDLRLNPGETYYIKVESELNSIYDKVRLGIYMNDDNSVGNPIIDLPNSFTIDFEGDVDCYTYTPTNDQVIGIYTEEISDLKGYILNSSNSVLTYDDTIGSQTSMFYTFKKGVTYKFKFEGPVGVYNLYIKLNVGKQIIEKNSSTFTSNVVYEKTEILGVGKRGAGYFSNSYNAEKYVQYFFDNLSLIEEWVIPSAICLGASSVSVKAAVFVGLACSYYMYEYWNWDDVENLTINLIHEVNGPVYVYISSNTIYVVDWSGTYYFYDDVISNYTTMRKDRTYSSML